MAKDEITAHKKYMEFMIGKELIKGEFHKTPQNDHEHCIFCWQKINDQNNKAYCIKERDLWVCKDCFQEYGDEYNWHVNQDENEW